MISLDRWIDRPGTVPAIRHLAQRQETAFARAELLDVLASSGVDESESIVDVLLESGLCTHYGGRIGISRYGHKVALLLDAMEGGDVDDVFRRLRRLDGREEQYQLVREGMTRTFFESLLNRPGFRRLYICSPWVNPSEREAAMLQYAMLQAQRSGSNTPEVLLITRPPEVSPPGTSNGVIAFTSIGARMYFNRKLHTKLYIREPDQRGGYSLAIVGSENLTRSTHLELGIRINSDSQMIDQLIRYFFEIMSRSTEQNSEVM